MSSVRCLNTAMYEAKGKIKVIFDTQEFPSGFSKREFVVTTGDDNYPQDIKFEIIKDKCAWLDKFEAGQEVAVHFDIRGNEYKDKYYVNLNCWKILGGAGSDNGQAAPQSSSSEVEPSPDDLVNDDIPF
jgi:single-strand DNA-binding protein